MFMYSAICDFKLLYDAKNNILHNNFKIVF
jgi:hypothetical protein